MKLWCRYSSLLILLFIRLTVFSQYLNWNNYTITDHTVSFIIDNSEIWACTPGGLVSLNIENGDKLVYNHANFPFHFNPKQVLLDSQQTKWFYNEKNIVFYENGVWDSLEVTEILESDDLGNEFIYKFIISPESRKYILVHNSNSIYELEDDSHTLIYQTGSSPDQVLSDLECDNKGNIWVSGIGFVAQINDSSATVFNSENSVIPNEYILDIYIDQNDNLWVIPEGSGNMSVLMYAVDTWTSWEKSTFADFDILFSSIQSDNKGNIWLGSFNGIYKYDSNTWDKVLDVSADNIYVDKKDQLWRLYNGKINKQINDDWIEFDLSTNTLDPNLNHCLSYSENGVFIGGESGISHFNGIVWKHYPTDNPVYLLSSYSNGKSLAVIGDKLGTLNEYGAWSPLNHPDLPARYSEFHSIFQDSKNIYWIGTENGLFNYTDGNITMSLDEPVYDITEDSFGVYWIATRSGLIKYQKGILERFTSENSSLISNFISNVEIDSNNQIWLSAQNLIDENCSNCVRWKYISHLVKFDGNHFSNIDTACCLAKYFIDEYNDNFLFDKIVASPDNDLWVINTGLMNVKNGEYKYFKHENSGLAENNLNDLIVDQKQNVWILHDKSLSVYNAYTLNYNYSNNESGENLIIFPNPSNEHISIYLETGQDGEIEVSIFDLAGKEVLHELENIVPNKPQIQISVSELNTGIYLLIIENGGKLYKGKFVKL